MRLESAPKNMRGEVEVAGLFKAEQNQQHMERPQDMAARRAEARRWVAAEELWTQLLFEPRQGKFEGERRGGGRETEVITGASHHASLIFFHSSAAE